MRPLKILIADDHAIIRDGFRTILAAEHGMEVTAVAKDGKEAWEKIKQTDPDIIILDWDMPGGGGCFVMDQAKEERKEGCFLVLSSSHDDHLALEALKKGATGFLLKDWDTDDIIQTIKSCAKGKLVFPSSIAPALRRSLILKKNRTFPSLSDPEEEVLAYMAEGAKNKEIAESLYLSEGTIRNYISSIYRKLGVANRSEVIELFKKLHH